MSFFGGTPVGPLFTPLSMIHCMMLAIIIIAIVVTVIFRESLRESHRLRRYLPIGIGCIAWICEVGYHLWNYVNDLDFVANLIPLELCSISIILTVVLCFTRSRAVFEIYYFISFGAVMSLLFPDQGGYGPNHFRFWHFFIVHSFIVWLTVWYLCIEKYTLRRTALLRLVFVMTPVAALAYFANSKLSTNYMFLSGTTEVSSPLDFLGDGVGYVIKLFILAYSIFTIMYLCAPKEPRQVSQSSRDQAVAGSNPVSQTELVV